MDPSTAFDLLHAAVNAVTVGASEAEDDAANVGAADDLLAQLSPGLQLAACNAQVLVRVEQALFESEAGGRVKTVLACLEAVDANLREADALTVATADRVGLVVRLVFGESVEKRVRDVSWFGLKALA